MSSASVDRFQRTRSLLAASPLTRRDWALLLVLPGAILFVSFMVVPILYLVYLSLTDATTASTAFVGGASFVGLDNYVDIFTERRFYRSFGITWLYVAVSLVIKIVVAVGIALLLTHPRVVAKRYMRAAVIVPLGFPAIFSITIWRGLFSDARFGVFNRILLEYYTPFVEWVFGIVDTVAFFASVSAPELLVFHSPVGWLSGRWTAFFSFVTVEVWMAYPFMVIIIVSALQDVPEELHEAAKVDGAGYYHRFMNVTLPSIRRPVLFASILTAATSFQSFLIPWILNRGGPARQNELILVYGYREAIALDEFALSAAILVVAIIVIGILMWLTVKYGRLAEGVNEP